MSKTLILGVTLIILLVPVFLISAGTTGDSSGLWWTGLILLCLGGIIPPVTRYAYRDDNGDQED